ncbi:MAG: MFS transporter [Aristaeellaceae bacterium]
MDTMAPGWKKQTVLFLISQCVTLFGSMIVQMAVIWYVTLTTASGVWVAAFTVCSYLPQFLISFVGGVWADRFSRRRLIILADGLIAGVTLVMVCLMPLVSRDSALLTALLIMSALRSLGAGVQTPAVGAMIPALVPEKHLMRFNGINATLQSVVQFAAPAAAGAILAMGSLRATLLLDVLTAAVGISLLCCVRVAESAPRSEGGSMLGDITAGVRYAFSDRGIGRLLSVYGLFIFLSVPAGFMSGLLISRTYGDTYWYLTAAELTGCAGMAAGGMLMGLPGGMRSRTGLLALGLGVAGAMTIGLGVSPFFLMYLALMFVYSMAITAVQTASTTLIQETADPAMQGRVFGLMGAMYSGFLPLGMLAFGPLADVIPLQALMIATGMPLLALALFAARRKTWR